MPSIVLVASPLLMARSAQWNGGHTLVTPADLSQGSGSAENIEVIVTGETLDSGLVASLPNLKLVACFSTGYGGIDVALLRSRGIALTTAAGVNAHDVADHAIALLLAWWHRIPASDQRVRAGGWRDGLVPRPSLRDRRAGIVGLGRIGEHIARRAEALGLSVSWWGPHAKPEAAWPRAASLLDLARDSDVLFVATRASPENARQIDAAILHALGPEAVLVNVSRGMLVDEAALLQALEQHAIAGAALDVFDCEPPDVSRWKALDNVVLSPHLAGYTQEAGSAMFGQLGENLRRYFAGEPLLTPVSY
jgi:lactate dehydrogenase-like 2-hydroxyacid dehydrogenase